MKYLIALFDILLWPVRRYPRLFVFTQLMHGVIMVLSMILPLGNNPFLAWLLPIFDGYMVCVLAALLSYIWLQWIPILAFLALTVSEIFCALFYGSLYNAGIVRLVVETNPSEAGEFLGAILTSSATWITLAVTIASACLAHGVVRGSKRISRGWKTGLLYTAMAIVVWSGSRQIPAYVLLGRCFTATDVADLGSDYYMPQLNTTVNRAVYYFALTCVERKELDILCHTVTVPMVDGCDYRCPTIVLIIGESFNKHQSPLYNEAALPVNPHLTALRDSGNLVVCTDVVSPSNMTSRVMRSLFSTWHEGHDDGWMTHSLFPVLFRQAGYEVYYLTNQFAMVGGDVWNTLGGTLFNHPELSAAQFSWRNPDICRYDEYILPMLPESARTGRNPQLIIVHLMGQHVDYASRYPETFARFTADDTHPPFGGRKGREIAAEYANATLYNDSVVNEIWRIFANQDAVGIYLSDHGEEVYDWRNYFERTDEARMSREVARYQFEVPMMFLMTDTFRTLHPEIVECIQRAKDLPAMNTRISHTLLGLAGIDSREYSAERDMLSPGYNASLPRIIGTGVDYDELMRKE